MAKPFEDHVTAKIRDEASKLDAAQAERRTLAELRKKNASEPETARGLSEAIREYDQKIALKRSVLASELKPLTDAKIQIDYDHTRLYACGAKADSELKSTDGRRYPRSASSALGVDHFDAQVSGRVWAPTLNSSRPHA